MRVLDSTGCIKVAVTTRTLKLDFVEIVAATYTIDANDCVVYGNRATAQTFTLPPATGTGNVYVVKQIGVGTVTVDGDGADTIDGQPDVILGQYDSVFLQDADSGVWFIL